MKELRNVLAIDFDGTLCENKYPDIGEPFQNVIEAAKNRQKHGWGIILWTCRKGEYLDNAVAWCKEQGLEFDAVNQSLPEWIEEYGESRKVGATEYWDDKSFNPVSRECGRMT